MSDNKIINCAKLGSIDGVLALIHDQADVNVQDEHGWTPLNWAAGTGDARMVKLLLEKGADCSLQGRDNRRAWMIARAAGHRDVADLLMEAEKTRGIWKDPYADVPYCKAFRLEALRAFPHWTETEANRSEEARDEVPGNGQTQTISNARAGDTIVYLHENYVVTSLMWKDEDILFDQITPEWIQFCRETLEFQLPMDQFMS